VPPTWGIRRSATALVAKHGDSQVSATVFTLLKPYDPAHFQAAARELDRIAAKLAAKAGGSVTDRASTVVDGRKTRAYRYVSKGMHMRIGFLLEGKREYQLLCVAPGTIDIDGACTLLFTTFRAG